VARNQAPMMRAVRLLSWGRRVQTLTGLNTASADEALQSRFIQLWSHSEPLHSVVKTRTRIDLACPT
jgi:hypothetical protein